MALASFGALVAMSATAFLDSRSERDFADEWNERLRIKSAMPPWIATIWRDAETQRPSAALERDARLASRALRFAHRGDRGATRSTASRGDDLAIIHRAVPHECSSRWQSERGHR
jgi:hypothetical protein